MNVQIERFLFEIIIEISRTFSILKRIFIEELSKIIICLLSSNNQSHLPIIQKIIFFLVNYSLTIYN